MASLRITCPGCSVRLRIRSERAAGRQLRCPKCQLDFVAAVVEPSSTPSLLSDASKVDDVTGLAGSTGSSDRVPVIRTDDSASVASRIRKRRSRKWPVGWIAALVLGGTAVSVWWQLSAVDTPDSVLQEQTSSEMTHEAGVSDEPVAPVVRAVVDPISLDYFPVVPQVLLHLHPAEMWAEVEPYPEFTGTLGDIGTWLKNFVEESTRFDVAEIAELTVALNFGARGSVPDVAIVVRLVDEHPQSQLLQQHIGGTMVPDLNGEIIESGDFAWMIIDSRTIAMATLELANDLADARKYPAVPTSQMESMLRVSNRNHHATLFVDLQVLDTHKDLVLVEQLHQLAETTILWFRPDVGALSWSMHLEPHLTMETWLTPTAATTSTRLQRRMLSQLKKLPEQLHSFAATLTPRTPGQAKIIGRFPAMVQALELGTEIAVVEGMVVLRTVLPQKAAANLAAGAILTWNQTVVQDSSHGQPVADRGQQPRTSLADQLQREVLVDFRRAPLHEAIEYLGQALDVRLEIDGDALMLAGFTQNMPQTHDLGSVTVLQALNAIVSQYDGKMVLTYDSAETCLWLTTDAAVGDRTILKTD